MAVQTVGVRELKNRLSEFIRLVKSGDTIVITEHGKPVCWMIPQQMTLDEKLLAMRDAGLLEWSGKKFELPEPAGRVIGSKTLAELIVEERR